MTSWGWGTPLSAAELVVVERFFGAGCVELEDPDWN